MKPYDENLCKIVIEYFKSKGLNGFAISGILANWLIESGFVSGNAQNSYMKKLHMTDAEYTSKVDTGEWPNFESDAIGYGLAQWTSKGRKTNLLNLKRSTGKSIADMNMQLDFSWSEITSKPFKKVYDGLINATDAGEAALLVMIYYEMPGSVKSETARAERKQLGYEFYNKYFKEETTMMKASEFVEKLVDVATNYKTLYVLGCFGAPLNEKNKQRYTNNQEYNGKPVDTLVGYDNGRPVYVKQSTPSGLVRKNMIMAADSDTFGFDCVCTIKGILWGWNGDVNRTYGGANYGSNGVPDIGANTMIRQCFGVTTDFSNIQPGEAVWVEGHIGVYIGDGKVVECSPKFENKVQITNLGNVGNKVGNYRMWTKHGRLPWVEYDATAPAFVPNETIHSEVGTRTYVVQKGDTTSKIAARYNTTVERIVNDNIKNHKSITKDHIVTGWKLIV